MYAMWMTTLSHKFVQFKKKNEHYPCAVGGDASKIYLTRQLK